MEETLGAIGFVIVLGSWFAMFARLRRDARRVAGSLSDYVGAEPPFFGRSGWSLLPRYWRHYGFDVRMASALTGVIIMIIAAVLAG